MALIAMAVHDTVDNQRTQFTVKTVKNLHTTVDLYKHRLFIINNFSCEETTKFLREFSRDYTLIENEENIGTAEAINLAWQHRQPGENAVKMDNDVIIHSKNWVEQLEEAIQRDERIGICGLKRKDCIEHPMRDDYYKSILYVLPHKPGQRWIIGEKVKHVMGTCQMYSSALLDKIGYLYQPRLYGYDDALAAIRCQLAEYFSVFLPHIEIDHIDPGDNPYQKWKEAEAGKDLEAYHRILNQYTNGTRPIYYNPFQKPADEI